MNNKDEAVQNTLPILKETLVIFLLSNFEDNY